MAIGRFCLHRHFLSILDNIYFKYNSRLSQNDHTVNCAFDYFLDHELAQYGFRLPINHSIPRSWLIFYKLIGLEEIVSGVWIVAKEFDWPFKIDV